MGAALGIDTLWRTHNPKSLFVKTSKQNEQKSVIFIIVSLVCIFATNVFSNAFKYSTFWLYSLQKLMLPSGNYNQILIEFSYKVRYIYSLILRNEILLPGGKNAGFFFHSRWLHEDLINNTWRYSVLFSLRNNLQKTEQKACFIITLK